MKLVILAGGLGSRLSEETSSKPKPMVEIGGKPILWHIMKIYSYYGINDFIVCCGYKGYIIKEYFANYFLHTSDFTFDMVNDKKIIHKSKIDPWKVTLVDTGNETRTGGRLKRVSKYIGKDELFFFTYGDGLSNVNINKLISFHKQHGKLATITTVIQPGRYGLIKLSGKNVSEFIEKPLKYGGLINGGFFVLSPKTLDLIDGDSTSWELDPVSRLVEMKELMAYRHDGFFHAMDTLRDKNHLENLWQKKSAPWKIW